MLRVQSQHYGGQVVAVLQVAALSVPCLLSSEQRHKQLGMRAEPWCFTLPLEQCAMIAAKGSQAHADHDASAAQPSTAAAEETDAKADVSAASGASELPIQLSAMRKADVSPFKGAVYVSIREYYEVGLPACCPSRSGQSHMQSPLYLPVQALVDHVQPAVCINTACTASGP